MLHPCKNYLECGNYAGNSSPLCEDCKEKARELDQRVRQQANPQPEYIRKNEGLRRHKKGKRK